MGAVQAPLLRQGNWEAAEPVRPLGNIGDGEPGGPPKAPNVLRLFPQNQAEQTGLSASVSAAQAQPLTMLQCEADREVCRPSAVEDHQVTALQKPLAVVPKGAQLQTVRPLHILEQRGLFLDGPLLAGLQILCPLHQLCGLVPQVAPVRTQSGISAAILALLHPVGPEGGPAGRLLQAADLSPQGLISRGLPLVPAIFFLVTAGKVPLDQLRASAVQSQRVVGAGIQKGPVVGHQKEAAVQPPEVPGCEGASGLIQVVGRLVQHGVPVPLAEQPGQPGPGLLSAAEGGKRAVQNVLVQPQAVQLPQEHPLLLPRDPFQQDLPGRPLRLRHQAWKIDGAVWPGEDSAAGQAPLQQTEQSCLAPAIAAHKPQFPAGVQLKVQVLKDGDVVPLIGKGKILNGDL